MTDSPFLKLRRAAEHITQLDQLLRRTRPFFLVLKTNTQTGERTLGCERNHPIVDRIAVVCGDAIHKLCSALDHAYWEIVSPHCRTDRELRAIQFPFTSNASRLDNAIRQRMGHRAGTGFYCAIRRLVPYGDLGGNLLLFLIHEFDVTDKHKLLLPAVDESTLTFQWLESIDANNPWKGWGGSMTLSEHADIKWINNSVPVDQLGTRVGHYEFKRMLDVPISVVIPITLQGNIVMKLPPAVPMLLEMAHMAEKTISIIRAAANSC